MNLENEILNDKFYLKYDKLIWNISRKWYPTISRLSKNNYDIDDIHNELWAHVCKKINTYDPNKGTKISSWMYMICECKAGMIKRSFETKKNNLVDNEASSLNANLNSSGTNESAAKETELLNIISNKNSDISDIAYKDFILDYIYSLMEFIDACTEKERKIYLLKIKGKNQNEIAEEAKVSKPYIPKVYKKKKKKFKTLYDSLDQQEYINKEERNKITNELIHNNNIFVISEKYNLEIETVCICKEIIKIIGI